MSLEKGNVVAYVVKGNLLATVRAPGINTDSQDPASAAADYAHFGISARN